MSNLFELIKATPMYAALLEQVPEEERAAAIEELQRQIAPYEALVAGLPAGALDSLKLSPTQGTPPTDPPGKEPGRRLPRRF